MASQINTQSQEIDLSILDT